MASGISVRPLPTPSPALRGLSSGRPQESVVTHDRGVFRFSRTACYTWWDMDPEDILSRPSVVSPAEDTRSVIARLFRTKPIEQILADADHPTHRLKKSLTAWDLTCLGIGAIIGTGIFVLI